MITLDDIRASHEIQDAHYNMGERGFGYGFRNIKYPRLKRISRCWKAAEIERWSTAVEWYVDGIKVGSLDVAIERLNQPVVITGEELEALKQIPVAFEDWHRVTRRLAGIADSEPEIHVIEIGSPLQKAIRIIEALLDKDLVEHGSAPHKTEDYCISVIRRRPLP